MPDSTIERELLTWVVCECKQAEAYHWEASHHTADYLRRLADQIEAGEICHVSVSAHPKRRGSG